MFDIPTYVMRSPLRPLLIQDHPKLWRAYLDYGSLVHWRQSIEAWLFEYYPVVFDALLLLMESDRTRERIMKKVYNA